MLWFGPEPPYGEGYLAKGRHLCSLYCNMRKSMNNIYGHGVLIHVQGANTFYMFVFHFYNVTPFKHLSRASYWCSRYNATFYLLRRQFHTFKMHFWDVKWYVIPFYCTGCTNINTPCNEICSGASFLQILMRLTCKNPHGWEWLICEKALALYMINKMNIWTTAMTI